MRDLLDRVELAQQAGAVAYVATRRGAADEPGAGDDAQEEGDS